MKTTKIFKELLIGSIVVAPLLYYFYLWNSLPNEIPIHFDAQGNPNNYGSKSNIALTLLFLSVGAYSFLMCIPKIDPKKNFSIFNNTFVKLRFILSLFFSAICFIIIFSVKERELNTSLFYIAFAILISLIGNYMSNIRPNYFLGIRTPWTLESERNWKKTHFFTGRLWFFSGIFLAIMILVLPVTSKIYVFTGIIILLALFPVLYSYIIYSKNDKSKSKDLNTKNLSDNKNRNANLNESDVWVHFFYMNRYDSRIIVPKRNKMMGWTLNLGNPYTYVLIIILIALIILSKYLI
jgi:uncharacterized membrane protein